MVIDGSGALIPVVCAIEFDLIRWFSSGSSDCDQASERERSIVYKIGTQTQTSIELTTSKTDGVLTVVINGKADR